MGKFLQQQFQGFGWTRLLFLPALLLAVGLTLGRVAAPELEVGPSKSKRFRTARVTHNGKPVPQPRMQVMGGQHRMSAEVTRGR